jgi:hypothetical protein
VIGSLSVQSFGAGPVPDPLPPPGQVTQRVGVAVIGSLHRQHHGPGLILGLLPQPSQFP